jgi:hypothetical protein
MNIASQPIRNYALPHSEIHLLRRRNNRLSAILCVVTGMWFLSLVAALILLPKP